MKKRIYLIIVVCFIGLSNVFAQQGFLKGKITDKATGEELVGAAVVVDQTTIGTTTDFNGEYKMPALDAGSYTIRVQYVSYDPQVIKDVQVKPGQETVLNIQLAPATTDIKEVAVTAKANRESENMLLLDQKKAVVATQAIGAQELSRKGVSDAEGAVTKVSGISKQEGVKNVFVRGLGDRYNFTTLNGFPLPSEDPEYKNISLDFFTSDIIKSVGVNKVFDAEAAGDVAGAQIDISSKELVGKSEFNIGVSGKANTETANHEFLLVDGVSGFGFAQNTNSPSSDETYGFKNSLDPTSQNSAYGKGVNFAGGKRFEVGPNHNPLSFYVIGDFSHDFSFKDGILRKTTTDGTVSVDYNSKEYESKFSHIGMINLNFRSHDYELAYNFLAVHSSNAALMDDEGVNGDLFQDDPYTGLVRRQQINDNTLLVNQLQIKREINTRLSVHVGGSYNLMEGKEPDRRTNTLGSDVDNEEKYIIWKGDNQYRFYGDLKENDLNVLANVKYRFSDDVDNLSSLTIGYKGRFLTDDYSSSAWNNKILGSSDVLVDVDGFLLDDIYNQENYENGVFYNKAYKFSTYTVDKVIHSPYANLNYELNERLVFNFGLKADDISINIDYNVNDGARKGSTPLDKFYLLPSLNLKYSLNDKNSLRFGASETYTLPQSKEISPMLYDGRQFDSQGNQYLQPSTNYNVDLKWDYYLSPSELLSVTVFGKMIKDPISRVEISSAGGYLSYANIADKATVGGVEVEIRKNIFSVFDDGGSQKKLSLGANLSYLSTGVNTDNVSKGSGSSIPLNFTNSKTELEGASPLLVNGDLSYMLKKSTFEWNSSLVVNYFTDRIYSVGVNGYNDIMENSRPTLDFITSAKLKKHFGINFKVKNLLNPEFKLTREASSSDAQNIVLESYKKGMTLDLGLSYTF